MTLDPEAITFRLDSLMNSSNKNSEKELLSIIKVFEELNKEKKRLEKSNSNQKNTLEKMNIDKILVDIQNKIKNSGNEELVSNFIKSSRV
jgi:transcriptional regulator NrdR family protein